MDSFATRDQRSDVRFPRQRGANAVADVLVDVERALSRARSALAEVSADGEDLHTDLTLSEAVQSLERTRHQLVHSTVAIPRMR